MKSTNGTLIGIFFIVSVIVLAGCSSDVIVESTQACPLMTNAESSECLLPSTEGPIDPSMVEEHLSAIQEAKDRFRFLLNNYQEELEAVSKTMLHIQQECLEEGHSESIASLWKNPYFVIGADPPLSVDDPERYDPAILDELERTLFVLSADGTFSMAYPDLTNRIADVGICQYKVELVDSAGRYFAAVSLIYCDSAPQKISLGYSMDWISSNWLYCVEWHE